MMLSIVIPTLNSAADLPPCFAALENGIRRAVRARLPVPELEVVAADGGSADDTRAVAAGYGASVVDAVRGRGPQLAAGAGAARGEWLLFLHADTCLDDDWLMRAAGFINNPANARRAAAFRFALDDDSAAARRLEKVVSWRCRFLALPYGDQGLLIGRDLYQAVGGYRDLPLMEDVAIVRRLGAARLRLLDSAAVTSAARYRRDGWTRRSLRNLGCLSLYLLGLPTPLIARLYASETGSR